MFNLIKRCFSLFSLVALFAFVQETCVTTYLYCAPYNARVKIDVVELERVLFDPSFSQYERESYLATYFNQFNHKKNAVRTAASLLIARLKKQLDHAYKEQDNTGLHQDHDRQNRIKKRINRAQHALEWIAEYLDKSLDKQVSFFRKIFRVKNIFGIAAVLLFVVAGKNVFDLLFGKDKTSALNTEQSDTAQHIHDSPGQQVHNNLPKKPASAELPSSSVDAADDQTSKNQIAKPNKQNTSLKHFLKNMVKTSLSNQFLQDRLAYLSGLEVRDKFATEITHIQNLLKDGYCVKTLQAQKNYLLGLPETEDRNIALASINDLIEKAQHEELGYDFRQPGETRSFEVIKNAFENFSSIPTIQKKSR